MKVYESIQKFSKLLPILVAVILLFYGLFSVASNVRELENNYNYKWLMDLSEELGEENTFEKEIEKIKSEARMIWIISSIVYLVAAEVAVYLALKNSEANIIETTESNTSNEGFAKVGGFEQKEIEEQVSNQETQENPIKFDL